MAVKYERIAIYSRKTNRTRHTELSELWKSLSTLHCLRQKRAEEDSSIGPLQLHYLCAYASYGFTELAKSKMQKVKMANGYGLVCLVLNSGLAFTGFSLRPSDGTLSSDNPSETGSLKGATFLYFIFFPSLYIAG